MLNAKKVNGIIAEFERSEHIDLPRLLEMARVLSTQSYWYADALGEVSKQYRRAYVARKQRFAVDRMQYQNDGNSAAKATAIAEAGQEYGELLEKENDLEGRKEHGRIMWQAICNVLDRMNQEIAELRREERNINHTNGMQQ